MFMQSSIYDVVAPFIVRWDMYGSPDWESLHGIQRISIVKVLSGL
jgi:hypothetical protein